ncbi:SubName: Full=Uncharacterized protein {ECO:0000313/EMBL:CCA76748.1} [Serendipita indica DSM 11827]|nr:SubName: Full=Uncharacterized protein {ECO:0000313/EMBL:CCA76748.1} [Serendipita indica DSM 11827]
MAFSVPIQDSAPHIYISSLPFSPSRSTLHIEGLGEHTNALKVTRCLDETYPGLPRILQGHQKINAVAFWPDGSRIVSGSDDKTIRLWDAETGQPLGEPLRGHQGRVWAVAFSPDGSRIVSGSNGNTIQIRTVHNSNLDTTNTHSASSDHDKSTSVESTFLYLASVNVLCCPMAGYSLLVGSFSGYHLAIVMESRARTSL